MISLFLLCMSNYSGDIPIFEVQIMKKIRFPYTKMNFFRTEFHGGKWDGRGRKWESKNEEGFLEMEVRGL